MSVPAVGDPPKGTPAQPEGAADPWELHVLLLAEIKAAARYEVHELIAYKDGVWADFTVFNLNGERICLARQFLRTPVRMVVGTPKPGWHVAYFDGCRLFRDPDGSSSEPEGGRSIPGWSPGSDHKFFPRSAPGRGKACLGRAVPIPRPRHTAYPRLPNRGQNAFVTGRGKVPVTWVDEKAPASLPYCDRLLLK